jgi:hypothetical protein
MEDRLKRLEAEYAERVKTLGKLHYLTETTKEQLDATRHALSRRAQRARAASAG